MKHLLSTKYLMAIGLSLFLCHTSLASEQELVDDDQLFWSTPLSVNGVLVQAPAKQTSPILSKDMLSTIVMDFSAIDLANLAKTSKGWRANVNALPFAPAHFTPLWAAFTEGHPDPHGAIRQLSVTYGLTTVNGLRRFLTDLGVDRPQNVIPYIRHCGLGLYSELDSLSKAQPENKALQNTDSFKLYSYPHMGSIIELDMKHRNFLPLLYQTHGKKYETTFDNRKLPTSGLKLLPPFIFTLTHLARLHIVGVQLTVLPRAVSQLTDLQELKLGHNNLTHLPESLGNLSGLTTLDISDNRLQELPPSFTSLQNLTSLGLSNNRFQEFPEILSSLSKLVYLWLDDNPIVRLPQHPVSFPTLTLLSIGQSCYGCGRNSGDSLSSIAKRYLFSKVVHSPRLGSWCQYFGLFPKHLQRAPHLEDMDSWLPLIHSHGTNPSLHYQIDPLVKTIPLNIVQLGWLEELELSGCGIETIPDQLCSMTRLTRLSFVNMMNLKTIPPTIGNLKGLRHLTICKVNISSLPERTCDLENLEYLSIMTCKRMTDLPVSICKLVRLKSLTVKSTAVKELPPHFEQLTTLQQLDLSKNFFTTLPESVPSMTHLVGLTLKDNYMIILGDSPLWGMTNLFGLIVSDNVVVQLPPGFQSWANLSLSMN